MAYLVLVRHGESEWNAKGLWTGWTDIALDKLGHEQAKETGRLLKGIDFDYAFTSTLIRTKQTLKDIENVIGEKNIPIISTEALNERNYGKLTGKNKWEIEKEYGEDRFLKIRRGWNEPIPGGETLKDVYKRVIPYYQTQIEPLLKAGKNVLIAAHGNSLRALIKYLEHISDEGISHLELATGESVIYQINKMGSISFKEIRKSEIHDLTFSKK